VICFFLVSCKTATEKKEKVIVVPYDVEVLQRRTFDYFWETADTINYQVPDRYPTLTFSSIAATGFGLGAYIVGVDKGYVTREAAADRTLKTLQVLWKLPQGPGEKDIAGHKGFFYHFLTLDKATRFKTVELSSIDTGLLMAGILAAMSYFDGESETEKSIRQTADSLYRRVEWDWMMNDTTTMSMGYHPSTSLSASRNRGFIEAQWRGYNEAMVLILMAMGSPTHPIDSNAWDTWCSTYPWDTFYGQEHVNFDPLFGHQYSHMWIDFRGIQDEYMRAKGIDYFENSRRATLANRQY
jgi:hypothetical protein